MQIKKYKPLALGFIGGSLTSAVGYVHFSACLMDNKFTLDAGCFSKDKNESLRTADKYGVDRERTYTDWEEMLLKEKDKLDAVVILTPTPFHFGMVKKCLENGLPVICEKTLAITSKETKELDDLVHKKNGFLVVTYNYTGYPMLRELKQIIKDGKLGQILHFQAQMPQEGFIRLNSKGEKPVPQQWRLSDREVPTIHLDLATHLHEIIYYLTNEKPIETISDQASDGWFKNIIDNVTCLCRYSNNIQGQIWFSKSALGHRNGLEISIYGTKGSVKWVQMNPEELIISFVDGHKQILDRASNVNVADQAKYTRFKAGHPAGFIEAFANLYCDIEKALIEYKETGKWKSEEVFGADLATDGLKFMETMVLSSKTKKWEQVNS